MNGYYKQTNYKFEVMSTWLVISRSNEHTFDVNLLECDSPSDDKPYMTLEYDDKSGIFSTYSTIGEWSSSAFEDAIFEHLKTYGIPYLPDVKFEFGLISYE